MFYNNINSSKQLLYGHYHCFQFFHIGNNVITIIALTMWLLDCWLFYVITLYCSALCDSLPSVPSPSKRNSITHWLTLDQLAARKAKVMRATLLYPGDFTPSNPFLPLNFFFIPPFSLKVECSSTLCTKSHLLRTKASSSLSIHSLIRTLWSYSKKLYFCSVASIRKLKKEEPAQVFKSLLKKY